MSRFDPRLILAACTIALFVSVAAAEDEDGEVRRLPHHRETIDQPPAECLPPLPVGPPPLTRDMILPSVQVNVAAGQNIPGDAANEPSLAVDPTNPSRIVIGWRQFDSVASNFRQAGHAFSTDAGQTWTFPGSFTPGTFRSDPIVEADASGTFFYDSLRQTFVCDVFESADGGATWGGAISAYGGDKAWIAVDRTTSPGRGNLYVAWSNQAGCCGAATFTRSTDGGATFMQPIQPPVNPIFGTLAVAGDGKLYLSGVDPNTFAFLVDRSSNAQFPAMTPTFDQSKVVDLGGSISSGGPNPSGLLGQAWIDVDTSGGATNGYVYLLCSVDPPGSDPLDVRLARSTDQGATWGASVRVNDDAAGAWQWFGTMSVAPNGRIDVVWNDTRNSPTAQTSELTYASSTDGGVTFSANVAVGPPFDQSLGYPQQDKLGDYYDIVSDDLGASVAYAATYNDEEDVYYLRIGSTTSATPQDYLVGPGHGAGNANIVRIYAPGTTTPAANFFAYSAGQYGTNVAAGELDGVSNEEILTGPGPGPVFGPQVRGWSRSGGSISKINYYAYGTLKYGVNVASSNLDGDAFREILTGAGPGQVFGPHVRGWGYDNVAVTALTKLSYFAYGTLSYGVNVSSGSVDVDATYEILTGPGPGAVFTPQIRGWDYNGTGVSSIAGINFDAFTTPQFGAEVAGGSVDADLFAEIAASPGPGADPAHSARFRGFNYDGTSLTSLPGYDVTAFTTVYGGRLGIGDVTGGGRGDLVCSNGPDPGASSQVKAYGYTSVLTLLPGAFYAFPGLPFGCQVAAGTYGY